MQLNYKNRLFITFCLLTTSAAAQDTVKRVPIAPTPVISDTNSTETGVSISPSTIYFNAKPGGTQTKIIKIHNDTRLIKKFQIIYNDYNALTETGGAGEKVSPEYKYALSKWLSTSSSYIEVPPRETKTVTVTISVPLDELAAISAWTMIVLDQTTDRNPLDIGTPGGNTVSMGIHQGMSLGIFVYQNPPNVKNNMVDITTLRFEKGADPIPNKIAMEAKNIGDGIGFCMYYIELTNLMTGKTDKLKVRQFTILPGYNRKVNFELPKQLEKGKYSAVAVLDFGSKDNLQTAELEFTLN